MSNSTTKIFADRMQELIAASGKTIKDLADKIGVSAGALSKYQNDGAEAGIDALVKIAKYFDVSTDWLLGCSDAKTRDAEIRQLCLYTGLSEQSITELHAFADDFKSHPLNVAAVLIDEILEPNVSRHIINSIWRSVVSRVQYANGVEAGRTQEMHAYRSLNSAMKAAIEEGEEMTYISVHDAMRFYSMESVRALEIAAGRAIDRYSLAMKESTPPEEKPSSDGEEDTP